MIIQVKLTKLESIMIEKLQLMFRGNPEKKIKTQKESDMGIEPIIF